MHRPLTYIAAATLLFAPASLFAADRSWNNTAGGDFADPTNWLNLLPPGTGDTAAFDLATAYTVTLSAPVTLQQLFIDHDNLTLNLSGNSLTTTTTLFTQPSVTIGKSAGSFGTLLLQNGTLSAPNFRVGDLGIGSLVLSNASVVTSNTFYAGVGTSSAGIILLTGSNSILSAAAQQIGAGGVGILQITGGASMITSGANESPIGLNTSARGTVTISGAGSSWTGPNNYITVGWDGTGVLQVNALGSLSCFVFKVGQDATGSGLVLLDGANPLGRSTIAVTSDAYVGNSGKGTLTITGGALFSVGGNFNAGLNGTGSGLISVTGASSGIPATLSVAGTLNLGNIAGMGSLSIGNGGIVSSGGPTNVGGFGKGTLVLGGGSLSTHGLLVWSGGIFSHNSGLLVVDHGLYQPTPGNFSLVGNNGGTTATLRLANSATLTQNGSLFVGGTSASSGPGSGILNLESNSTASFTGPTRVWTNGTLNIAGGFLKSSSLTLSGGVFSFTAGGLLLTASDFRLGATGIIGPSLTLSNAVSSRNILSISGTTTFDAGSSLTLTGGTFSTGKFINNGVALQFTSGALAISNDNYTVGAGTLLGTNIDLIPGQSFSVSGTVTINAGASLTLDGGAFSAAALVNNGSFIFNSGTIGGSADLILDPGQLLGPTLTLAPGRSLSASQGLIVGKTGAATLTLAGGTATSLRGYLAQQPGSNGHVFIDGTASTWTIGTTLSVGGSDSAAGGTATLSITSGASVLAGSAVTLYPASSTFIDSATLGGSTIVNRGILQLANNARIAGNLANLATLTLTAGNATVTGTLSNSTNLQVLAGTLTLQNGAGTSSGAFAVSPLATLEFKGNNNLINNTTVLPVGSSITGAGTLLFSTGGHLISGLINMSQATVTNASVILNANATINHLTVAATSTPSFGIFSRQLLSLQSLDFLGGGIGGTTGTGTVSISGPFNITGTASKFIFQGTINAAGQSLFTGESDVSSINFTTFNNLPGATFEAQSGAFGSISRGFGPSAFNNSGTVIKSTGTGSLGLGGAFNNNGTVQLLTGGLYFPGGGNSSGSFFAAAATKLSFASSGNPTGTNFGPTASLTSLGDVTFTDTMTFAGHYNVAGNSTFSQVTKFLVGADIQSLGTNVLARGQISFSTGTPVTLPQTTLTGRLGGTDTLTTNLPFTWNTVSIDSAIDAHLVLNAASTWSQTSDPANKQLNGQLDNHSYATWTGGTIIQTGTFNNYAGATFEIQGQDALEIDFGSSTPAPFNNAGTILKSTGNFTNIYPQFTNTGNVIVQTGALIFGRDSTSSGTYNVSQNASLGFVFGTHTLLPSSSITGQGGIILDGEQVTLRGTVNVSGSSSLGSETDSNPSHITGDTGANLTNLGTELTIWNNATLTLNTGHTVTLHNLTLWGKIDGTDSVIVDGTFEGRGSLTAALFNAGHVSPGASPGTLLIAGNYTQLSQASLDIELAPANLVGSKYLQQFDILTITGIAHLAGALNLSELDGFIPDPGTSWKILTYASHTGQFDSIIGQDMPEGRHFNLIYGPTSLTLTVTAIAPIPEPATLFLLSAPFPLLLRRRKKGSTA